MYEPSSYVPILPIAHKLKKDSRSAMPLPSIVIFSVITLAMLVIAFAIAERIFAHVASAIKDMLAMQYEKAAITRAHQEFMHQMHEKDHDSLQCVRCIAVKGGRYTPALRN